MSTEEQAREGQSIESQIDRLTAYAKFQRWTNVEVFSDEGESAKNMQRPQMQRLLRLIKDNRVAVVATMAVDRCSRDLLDMLQFVQLCEEHKTAYVCAALNFDTSTPIGRMTLQILAAFAEFERQMIATRTRTNMADIAAKQKRYLGGKPPFGYRFDERKHLVVVPEEAEWLRQAADRFIAGHGYLDIAKWLNAQGVKTARNVGWASNSVYRTITNEVYIGRLIYGRRWFDRDGKVHWREESEWLTVDDAHPAILTAGQWQGIMARAKSYRPKGGQKQMKYRLSGLLRCGYCGSIMGGNRKGTEKPKFICITYQKKGGCRHHAISVTAAEAAVASMLERLAGGEINIPVEALENAQQSADQEHQRRMAAIDTRFQRQIQAYENGLIGERDLQLARERVEKERDALVEEHLRAAAPLEADIKSLVLHEARQALWLWDHGELPVLHATLRRIFDHIVVREGAIAEYRLAEDIYASDV